ncbi:complement receptor type 2 [Sarcophilus harrisii]|uniref:complement receptor type 2 n=1 Tax=Sarcophilus harrisii TaxID=9305 RepID=UPI001301B0F2|nr:complement receptor type 2 [Sarcophilus harrisii]
MGAALLLWGLLALLTPGICGQCLSPPRLNFARPKYNSKSVFDIGYALTFECLPGYMSKIFKITCLKNSTWSSVDDNICKRRSCRTPAELLNGKVQITNAQFGSTIKYSCDDGYQLIGHSSNQCIISENTVIWENEAPLCEVIRCELPPAIPNGRYKSTNEYFHYDMVVSYECNTGPKGEKLYDLVGNKTLYCTSKDNKVGIWNSPPPQCITPVKCQTPLIANGRNVRNWRHTFTLNDAVELECNPGFTMKGSKVVQCQSNSQWKPALPVCFKGCLPPEKISHGNISSTKDSFSFGDIVSYVCEPGYFLNGTALIKCIEPGKWNSKTPKCEVKSCENLLDQLPNGHIISPGPPSLGSKVSFVCDEGFWLNGSSSSTCVLSGMTVLWNNKIPVCERILCDSPLPISNGRLPVLPVLPGNKVPYGTTIRYSCFKSFRMIGTRNTICTSKNQVSGVWSEPAPRCETYSKTTLCPEPKVLDRHLKLRSRPPYRHGDTVIFACDTNFTLKGYSTLWCQANNRWAPSSMPTCESDFSLECPSPPTIPNGQPRNGHSGPVAPGLSVTYSCEPGYILVGERTIWCLSSGVWNTTAPKCKEALCDPLIKFPNGQVEEPSHLQIGAVMTFSCNKGKLAVFSAPLFIEVFCPPPPVIENGKYTGGSTGDVPFGTRVIYECNADPEREHMPASPEIPMGITQAECGLLDPGTLSLIGEETIHCTAGGVWKPFVPLCKAILCPPPPVIENGKYTGGSTGDVPFGTRVIYECNADPERGRKFNLIGERTLQCISNQGGTGKWSAAAPRCELSASSLQCLPPTVPNGHKISEQGAPYLLNDTVVFHCDAGFSLRGSSQIRCSASGTWDPEVPTCEKACQPPPEIPHGHHTGRNVGLLDPGTSVNYSCDLGYSLIGEETIHCTAGGVWKPFVPLCKAILCPPPPVIENGKYTGGSTGDVPFGTRVIYECNADPERGRTFNLIGERILQCISNQGDTGKWSAAAPRCELSASSLQCLPPTVPNGHKISEQGAPYLLNDIVVFHCDAGFSLRGSSQIRCSASGTWDPEVPICEKACQPPPEIPHGHHTGRNVGLLDPGTSVNYSCDLGYSLIGEETIHCTAGGVWKPFVPLCKAILCPPPPVIENGKYTGGSTGDVPFGTRVIYECNADPERGRKFNLIGERTLQCISNQGGTGKWSAAAPRCELSASSLQCLPPTVPNGHKISEQGAPYLLNDTVVFHCDAGFSLRGSSQIRCSASGTWDPEVPTCEKACQPPPEIPHGHHTGRNVGLLDPGTSVNYSCDLGYSLIGEETIHCTAGGVWKPFVPLCKAILCPPPPVIENGKYTGGSTGHVPFGTRVIYECNADPERGRTFNLIGERILQCISNQGGTGKWSAAAPRCELSASSLQCLPPTVPNGHKISEQGAPYLLNDTVVFHCDAGFSLRGSSQIRCSASGTWDPEVPTCEKECPPPPQISHGQHTGQERDHFTPGMSVNYTCDPGYWLLGNKSICCMPSGVWSLSAPQCEEASCEPIEEQLQLPSDGSPVVPVNSSCHEGYQLTGHVYKLCRNPEAGNRFWFQKIPLCKEVNCHLPEFIIGAHNVSTKKIYDFGAIFTLKCDEGYMLEGSPQSQCQEDHRWDPPLAVCKSLNYSSLLGSQGPLVLGGISLGTVLLILFAGIVLAIISKYKEGNYYTNENCKEVAIHLEAQADYNNDTYSFAT